jgi:hypothetical protein
MGSLWCNRDYREQGWRRELERDRTHFADRIGLGTGFAINENRSFG